VNPAGKADRQQLTAAPLQRSLPEPAPRRDPRRSLELEKTRMKRILLFLATNIAVLVVLSIVLQLLGVESILDEQGVGLDYRALLIFSAVFGMGGSFISLAISKWAAKRMTGAKVIEQPRGDAEMWLVQTVKRHADAAGIGMPEVAVYDDAAPNAFATGARKDSALVAVSTGLLHSMGRDEVDAVLGHEISHVANGDMVTLTLIQGVVNTFVIFLSRVAGYLVDRVLLRNEQGLGIGYFVSSIAFQIIFGILASTIVMAFSRRREFRADAGGARLAGRENMVGALEALKRHAGHPLPDQMQAFGISGGDRKSFARFFMSHPPLDERIEALKKMEFAR
jgi:heat shock protein HtpX